MSSIKGDVKKKLPPRPESEILSRDPAHFSFCFPGEVKFSLWSMLVSFLSAKGEAKGEAIELERAASETANAHRADLID
jgi:hypothetical protein